MMTSKNVKYFIITTFVSLYLMVSIISCIHTIDFFYLSNPLWLAITLAIAFEVGAAASLASIIVLEKMNKTIVWGLFFVLTAMQAMGNAYFAYVNIHDYKGWIELFGLMDYDIIIQKRILAVVSGAILPLISLGFIKALVDYIKPDDINNNSIPLNKNINSNKYIVNEDKSDMSEAYPNLDEFESIDESEFVPIDELKKEINLPEILNDDTNFDKINIIEENETPLVEDISAFHNIDAKAELTDLLSEQIAAEYDNINSNEIVGEQLNNVEPIEIIDEKKN